MANEISIQIAKYNNNKGGVETLDRLIPAEVKDYAKMHGKLSRIGINMWEYGADNKMTASAQAALEAYECKRLLNAITSGLYGTFVNNTKVHNYASKKDENGLVPVQQITIAKQEKDQNGNEYKLPWLIQISNGRAKPLDDEGIGYDKKTYKSEARLQMRMSNKDIYKFMSNTVSFIDAWEKMVLEVLYRKKAAIEKEAEKNG